jgi:exopolysaccharide biosynthesis polyprenyl glycosylphosphotransferase
LSLLLPAPLEDPRSERWLLSTLVDTLLVMLNWVLIGRALIGAAPKVALPHTFLPAGPSRTLPTSFSLLGVAFLQGTLIALLIYTEGLHNADEPLGTQARTLGKAVFWASAVLSAAFKLQGLPAYAAALVWGAGVLHFGTLLGWRWVQRERNRHGTLKTGGSRNVLIVGAGDLGRRVADYLETHPEMGRTVCGLLDDWKPPGNGVIGRVSDLAKLARTGFVDEVILAGPHDREPTLRLLRQAQQLRLDVKIAPDLFGCAAATRTEQVGGVLLVSLHEERPPFAGLLVKRLLDVAGATAALAFLAPALALVALLIKLDSPGPVLYAALRAGRKGRPFRCYKFRTMVKDADDLKGKLRERNQRRGAFFKITDDPRITRAGHLLRRYSLDELPQLWNVLIGDMSLVGPRPHPLDDFSGYAIEHLPRLDVTPGITGLWQVTARRDPSFQAGVDLDLEYIRCWSLGLDLRILLKTAAAVLRGSGD